MAPFIASLRGSGIVRDACKKAGINRASAYDRRNIDPTFASAWDAAMQDACDDLERIARDRAKRQSDTLLIFLLKAHRPEIYRETCRFEHTGKGGGPIRAEIEIDYSKLTDEELAVLTRVATRTQSGSAEEGGGAATSQE